ncbi:MAG: OmpA family protein [Bacteroidales bacterium]|nr:OmpA family protein [Bacteroidales bacterium]
MKKARIIAGAAMMFMSGMANAGDVPSLENIGNWQNIVSFSINQKEDHIVMTMLESDGSERAYESKKDGGIWGEAKPIESINSKCGAGENVGGIEMRDDERRLYFHANYADGIGGYDIYYCDLEANGWGKPVVDDEISTPADETFPSLTIGEQTIYFLKHQPVSDIKKENKEADRQSIYYAEKNAKGKWSRPLPENVALNTAYIQDVNVQNDGVTVLYSIRENKKEPSEIMFTRMTIRGQWYLPETILGENDGYDYFSPQTANGKIYFIRSINKKRNRVGRIVAMNCNDKMKPNATVTETGTITRKNTTSPIEADIVVYDPTSLNILGKYKSSDYDGVYNLTNPSNQKYIVDVRSQGYSFASYQLEYAKNGAKAMPEKIELFDTISISINVFDSEIFRPLDGKVVAVRTDDKSVFKPVKANDGRYDFRLPIGHVYNIIANANNFAENQFLFKAEGDIIFSEFEREIALDPKKITYRISVIDADTKEPLNANVKFNNKNRDEQVGLKAQEMAAGKREASLRLNDTYELVADGVSNYSFYASEITVDGKSQQLNIELIPLKANSAVRLNNINFATASADIMPESYPELDLVVKLMKENPMLRFEISAHTDNVGAAQYNIKLSEKRAESVTAYLVENGIDIDRLEPKGYGMSKPIVDNNSEENRAQNRRVEFMLIEAK